MVTISDKQSRLEHPTRVVLKTENLNQSPLSHSIIDKQFSCAGTSFSIISKAQPDVISLALQSIKNGESAAAIPFELLTPSAIFFDMDATVIAEESLVEIAKSVGKEREIDEITSKAMAGGMDFKESLRLRLAMLKGIHRNQILSVVPTLSHGMKQLADWCHKNEIPMFLVSGEVVDLAGPVSHSLGFEDFKANRFAWSDDEMAGHVEGEIIDAAGKRDAVKDWCKVHHLEPSRCICVGDGANDRLMMEICGLAVGFNPKKALWPSLHVANHTGDHRFLLDALMPEKNENV